MLIFTICARNYLAYALTLFESVREHEPEADFRIFLCDASIDAPDLQEFTTPLSALPLPDPENFIYKYSILELSTAIKPYCFNYAFDVLGHETAIFLDPDIRLFAPMDEVSEALNAGASCVLTPHLLAPLPEDKARPNNRDILASGTYNLGFAAFRRTPEVEAFLSWWGSELAQHCYVKLDEGLFVDQKFVDLAPGFLKDVFILRHKGYNVAYWNLLGRPIRSDGEGWTAGGDPLVFFHFSGVDPRNPASFSRHQDRFDMSNAGAAASLVTSYLARLHANGEAVWSRTPYAFASFDDGLPIPLPVRRWTGKPLKATGLRTYDAEYWNAPATDVDQSLRSPISRLMVGYHALRPDLQKRFPLSSVEGRAGFHDWYIAHGLSEYGLGSEYLPLTAQHSGRLSSAWSRFLARIRLRLGAGRQLQ